MKAEQMKFEQMKENSLDIYCKKNPTKIMEKLKDLRESEGVLLYLLRGAFWRTLKDPALPLASNFPPHVFILLH